MRPSRLVAGAVLTAALALGALPGIAGSRSPSSSSAIDPAAFQPFPVPANAIGRPISVGQLDRSVLSAAVLTDATVLTEPGVARQKVKGRPSVRQPAAHSGTALKPPRYKISGIATFYGYGTTAMRLPRGTTVIICGNAGCIERTISDYGPIAGTDRIVDLYTPDFYDICGCPSWAGETEVTVSVY